MRVLKECTNYFEAKLIVGRLENEGITAASLHEHSSSVYPLGSNASAFCVQVVVNEEDYDRAIKVISVDGVPDEDTDS